MDKSDFLILHYAAELKCPVAWLFSSDLGALTNKEPLEGSMDEIESALLSLARRGLVRASGLYDAECGPLTSALIAEAVEAITVRSKKEAEVFVIPELFYGLTEKGGRLWEEQTRPDWRMFGRYSSDPDTLEKEAEAATRGVLDAILKYDRYHSGEIPRNETIKILELKPWQPTYWKTLPSGFLATYKFVQEKPPYSPPEEARLWFSNQDAWFTCPMPWTPRPDDPAI